MKGNKMEIGKQVLLSVVLMSMAGLAMAAGATDPMAAGICKIVSTLTGKWAFGLSVVALIGVAGAFLFGVEMSEIMKKLAALVTAMAFIIGGVNILDLIYTAVTGASVGGCS